MHVCTFHNQRSALDALQQAVRDLGYTDTQDNLDSGKALRSYRMSDLTLSYPLPVMHIASVQQILSRLLTNRNKASETRHVGNLALSGITSILLKM